MGNQYFLDFQLDFDPEPSISSRGSPDEASVIPTTNLATTETAAIDSIPKLTDHNEVWKRFVDHYQLLLLFSTNSYSQNVTVFCDITYS